MSIVRKMPSKVAYASTNEATRPISQPVERSRAKRTAQTTIANMKKLK